MLITFVLTFIVSNAQKVGIGTDNPNAKLDIVSTDEGILIPRVVLNALNSASPLTLPEISELVYNTATAGIAPNNVTPGFYYWNGSNWERLQSGATNLTGSTSISINGSSIERVALTGDVTAPANNNVTTIVNDAVTNAKLANMEQALIKGRASGAGTGDPQDLTAAQVRTILNVADGATANMGTVTNIATGTGLTGGPITTTGTISLTNTGVTAGTYRSVTVDAQGRVTTGTNPTTLSAYGINDAVPNNRTITINGTTNRVTVTGGTQDLSGNRTWTISGPQDIHTTAIPTFGSGVYSSTNTVTTTISPNVRFINTTTGSGANDGLIVGIDGSGKAWLANKENTAFGISTNDLERVVIGADGSFRVATLPAGFVRTNASGVFSSAALTAAEIPNLDASKITTGTLPLSRGGTGSANAAGARTNLGLGTIATQNSNAVSITGGNMSGVQQTLRGNFRSIVDANTTLNSTDYFVYLGGGTSYTVTFPDPSVSGAGATLFFRTQYGGGTKTLASSSGSQIRWLGNPTPGAAWNLPAPCHCGLTFISDGAAWNLISYQ